MATRGPQQRIDIGNVMSLGFRTLGRNFLPFLAFALLLVGLPTFLLQYALWGELATGDIPFTSPYYWLTMAVSWITGYLLQGIIVRSAVLDLSGRPPDLGESTAAAMRMLFPMIGLSIVSGLGVGFGFILLIVPGIILMLMWMVAVPVLIEERRGVFESLSRSAQLTQGSKGWIFLLLLLYWGVSSVVSGVVAALTGFQMAFNDGGPMILPILAATIAQMLNALLLAPMLAALYVELRHFKEGAAPDHLAAIFE
jgi:hypothetical protein